MMILTGSKGCGKSLLLKGLIEDHDVSARGFLSLKRFSGPDMTGIDLLLFPEKKIIPMATTTLIPTEQSTSRFSFYPDVFSRVNMHFCSIPHDLPFILDEFGILEMDRRGHYPIFDHLIKSGHTSLIVVRRELFEGFLSTFGRDMELSVVDLETCGKKVAAKSIQGFLAMAQESNPG
ncbi:MAG TPA: hypothetical protein PLM29_10215 [Deltaproteobacteria bacterium]|nr:hypothetical protein [Deltaproteobacteria bacterium]